MTLFWKMFSRKIALSFCSPESLLRRWSGGRAELPGLLALPWWPAAFPKALSQPGMLLGLLNASVLICKRFHVVLWHGLSVCALRVCGL